MGSFNLHCKTGAVIQKDDEVVHLPVAGSSGYRAGYRYDTHFYAPLFPEPIRGVYNEYGGLEPCTTPDALKKLGEFFDEVPSESFLNEIQRLTLSQEKVPRLYTTEDRTSYLLTFRAQMYDYILASEEALGQNLRSQRDDLRRHLDDSVRLFDEFWKDREWPVSGLEMEYTARVSMSSLDRSSQGYLVYALSPWGSGEMWIQTVTLKPLTNALDRAHHSGDVKTFDELLETLIIFTQFREGLVRLGLDWTPACSSPVIQGDEMEYFKRRQDFLSAQMSLNKTDKTQKHRKVDEW